VSIEPDLAELEARLADPGYEPTLAKPAVIARLFNVTRQAVSVWAARGEHTGVRRHGQFYDVNECARWILKRNEAKATRGRQ
jgi:hypothetical protein